MCNNPQNCEPDYGFLFYRGAREVASGHHRPSLVMSMRFLDWESSYFLDSESRDFVDVESPRFLDGESTEFLYWC